MPFSNHIAARPSAVRPAWMRLGLFLLLVGLLLAPDLMAQSAGDFRTRRNGRWSSGSTWERYNGSSWINVNAVPDWTDGVITIRSGHSVQADDNNQYDQVVVEAGATLTITRTFGVVNGPGTDFYAEGTVVIDDDMVVEGGSSVVFASSASVSIERRSTLGIADASSVVFSDNASLSMSGDLIVEDSAGLTFTDNVAVSMDRRGAFEVQNSGSVTLSGAASMTIDSDLTLTDTATFTIDSGATLTNDGRGAIDVRGSSTLDVSGGTLINEADITTAGSGSISFGAGSSYVHAQDGGAFPPASATTWDATSTATVSGVDRNGPTEMVNTFGNLVWDGTGQSRDVDLAGSIVGVSGDFVVNSTGSRTLTVDGSGGSTLPISGDLQLNGGTLVIADGTTSSVSVGGNTTIAAGADLVLSDGGTGTLQFGGDLTIDGTVTTAGGGAGLLVASGPGTKDLTINGTLTGSIDLFLSGPGGVVAGGDLVIPGSVIETSGGLDMNGNTLSVEGDLIIGTSLTNVPDITFTGGGDSSLSLPPGSNSIPGLTIDKTGGTVTMLTDITVTSYVFIQGGTLVENGFVLTLSGGATFFSDQPYSGSVTISRTYAHPDAGWRMLASPVTNVSYSSLNAVFLTQGAPWATVTSGTANLQAFNVGSQDWAPVSGADGVFSTGEGFIFYAFAENQAGDPILPASWTVTGQPGAYAAQGLAFNTTADDSWNFVGNPGTANMDWDLTFAASSNIGASYATWDPALTSAGGTTGYKYYDASSGLGSAGRYIAPFTAYMVQATGAGASLQPSSSPAAAAQGANQFGKRTGKTPHFQLRVEGEQLAETETILSFGAEATDESNLFDVARLAPLSTQFVTVWSAVGDRRLAFDGRTMSRGQESYDIVVAGTRRGTYHIGADVVESIPSHWSARLIDLQTGNELDLLSGDSLRFQLSESDLVTGNRPMSATRAPRFRIVIQDPDRMQAGEPSGLPSADLPVLAQNFPNPFNPQTTIRFSLPESAPVRLEVYDMLGRRVALLVDGVLNAGWHDAQFDASRLSSGMYGYRLTVGSHTFARSMLLLR